MQVCCSVLQCVAVCVVVCCSVLVVCCIVLQCVAVCCSWLQLQCDEMCCNVLQCVAASCCECGTVCCRVWNKFIILGEQTHDYSSVLRCVAVCGISYWANTFTTVYCTCSTGNLSHTLQHTATRCNTLQHTATHCNTLQHTATHRNILQYTRLQANNLTTMLALIRFVLQCGALCWCCSVLQYVAMCCRVLQCVE